MSDKNHEAVFLDKTIVILGFILLCSALGIIVMTPVATAYEISIYQEYPFHFWILIISSLFCGISVLIRKSFAAPQPRLRLGGYILLIFTNLTIILLPIFRGYYINSRGDEITHIGYIVDILNTGHIGATNIYPISHVLAAQISLIGGLDIRDSINIVPICFYMLYALGLLLFAKNIARRPEQTHFVLAFGSVLLFTYFNYLFFPTQNIVYLIPLVVYLFVRSSSPNSLNYGICFVILSLSLPFLHPLGSLLICIIFIILNISPYLSRIMLKGRDSAQTNDPYCKTRNWTSVIVLFVLFFIWYSNFDLFNFSIKKGFASFLSGDVETPMSGIIEGIAEIQYSLSDTIFRIVKNYGQDILFAFLTLIAILSLMKRHYSKQESLTSIEIFLSLYFISFCLFAVSTILNPFLGTGSSLRLFCWPLVASVVLNGLVYQDWFSRLTGLIKKVAISTVLAIILISVTLGVFNTYFSPIIDNGDPQVTFSEWQSIEWFFNNKGAFRTFGFDQLISRSPDAFYGKDTPKPSSVGLFYYIPSHLGYDKKPSLRDTIATSAYLMVNEREAIVKKTLNPTTGTYTSEELDRVFSDPGIDFIYVSRGTRIGFVNK